MDETLTKERESQVRCNVEINDIEEALLAGLMFEVWSVGCSQCGFKTNPWESEEMKRLKPLMFWRDRNQWVFAMIKSLRDTDKGTDFFTVNYALKRIAPERHKALGGNGFFTMLIEDHKDTFPSHIHIVHWADLVYKSWQERIGKTTPQDAKPKQKQGRNTKRAVDLIEIKDE